MWKWIVGGGLLAVAAAVPVFLTESALHIPPERRTAPATGKAAEAAQAAGAEWKDAEITAADGSRQRGWLFAPPTGRHSGRAVLLLHGAGDTRRGMLGFARFFASRGFTALATDSRGHGVSGGARVTYGLEERDDVRRWIDYLSATRPGLRLYALGASMGASILIQALGAESRFRSVVAECPYATFRGAASERIPRLTGLPAWFSAPVVSAAFAYARLRHGVDFEAVAPVETIRSVRTPVLLIHGLDDNKTAPAHSRELHAANPQYTELWEVPGAHHVDASVVAPREFEERVLRWFEK